MNRDYKHENPRGNPLAPQNRQKTMKPLQCTPCGHAIARGMCSICFTPLCRRHMIKIDEQIFCADHIPGYQP